MRRHLADPHGDVAKAALAQGFLLESDRTCPAMAMYARFCEVTRRPFVHVRRAVVWCDVTIEIHATGRRLTEEALGAVLSLLGASGYRWRALYGNSLGVWLRVRVEPDEELGALVQALTATVLRNSSLVQAQAADQEPSAELAAFEEDCRVRLVRKYDLEPLVVQPDHWRENSDVPPPRVES